MSKAKGARRELEVMHMLERAGFMVTKSGGSLGALDLIGIDPIRRLITCIQVKSNRWWDSQRERHEMERIEPGEYTLAKQIWRIDHYTNDPLIREYAPGMGGWRRVDGCGWGEIRRQIKEKK